MDLWIFPLEGERVPRPFRATDFDESHAVFSPDSKWLAYTSNETGGNELYVQRFPELEGRTAISVGGGGRPDWSADGR